MSLRVNVSPDPVVDPGAPQGSPEFTDAPNGGVQVRLPDTPAADPTPAPERPSWLPEKFASPEAMAEAYSQLEKKLGQGAQAEPAPTTEAAAQAVVEEAGLDFNALTREFTEKGALSPETLASLEAKGITQDTVNQYIRGQQAIAEQTTAALVAEVGGQESMQQMLQWASANLTPAQIEAYNATVDGGNIEAAKLALKGLHAQYTAANGSEPKLVTGESAPPKGVEPFTSTHQIIQAMRDPRYTSGDPAYHAEVQRRLGASTVIGI